MIRIDTDKCTGCGLCTQICHESCLKLVDECLKIDAEYCSSCSQCVAICPVQALTWDDVPPSFYDKTRLPSTEQLDELFKQRRSIRSYTKEKISRPIISEIVNYGIYAPTHNYSLRVIVIDDQAVIQEFDQILMNFIALVYNFAYRPKVISWLANLIGMEEEYLLNKPKLEGAINRGQAFRYPAAIVFIVGDKKIPLSVDSAQYALANMMYYAQVKGIASCLWGNGPIFMSRSPKARKLLGLNRQDRIFGSMFLGYPAMKFRNKIEGRTIPIQWNGVRAE